jgi:hypothetical protein
LGFVVAFHTDSQQPVARNLVVDLKPQAQCGAP